MTKQEVMMGIGTRARSYGFEMRENQWRMTGYEIVAPNNYVNITLKDELEVKAEEMQIVHHIKVTACISHMGGYPTPQELMEQANWITAAAKLCLDFDGVDLNWVEQH